MSTYYFARHASRQPSFWTKLTFWQVMTEEKMLIEMSPSSEHSQAAEQLTSVEHLPCGEEHSHNSHDLRGTGEEPETESS